MAARLFALMSTLLSLGVAQGVFAQQPRDLFSDPKNLKVLPEDISREELRTIMRGFAQDLDLRCSSCHVGEEEQSIFDYDFAADDKELKKVAREMLKLVSDINARVTGLDRGQDHEFVKVTCITCHRKQSRPRMIEDIALEKYKAGGIEVMIAEYRELRERHYGGFTFDFSAVRLAAIAQSLAAASPEDAIRVHDLNVELNPNAAAAFAGRGEANQRQGRSREALDDFKKAMALDDDYAFLKSATENLEKELKQR